ncbi:MAG: murein hydrolase activator EnvC family protein [Pseudomonadota bacterium]
MPDRGLSRRRAGALGALALLAWAVTAAAADRPPAERLQQIEQEIDAERRAERRLGAAAAALERELGELRAQAIAAAAATQDGEDRARALESRLGALTAQSRAKADDLDRRRGELATLLSVLQRLARQPPEALLVLPAPPVDTVRSAKVLAAIVPPIESAARRLAQELGEIAALRARIKVEQEALVDALGGLAADRARVEELVRRRASLLSDTEQQRQDASERMARLARESGDLRDLIERLAGEPAARTGLDAARQPQARLAAPPVPAEGARRFSEAHGQGTPPARGRIVLSFGQPSAAGQPHRGLSIATRPEAQIVAPFDGHIVFAGPFRGYGQILIIEHGEGYHTLLAGLERVDGAVGQFVAAGEPVGATGRLETGESILYVELRRNGLPINPLPWLAAFNEKVSG